MPLARRTKTKMVNAELAKTPDKPRGRGHIPLPFDPDIAHDFLAELAKGKKSMDTICRGKGYPDRSVIMRWALENRDFASAFAQARVMQQHSMIDSTLDIAANAKIDPRRADLMIKVRQWSASRLAAKTYGDKVELDHSGFVGSDNTEAFRALSPEDREVLREMLLRAQAGKEAGGVAQKGLVIEHKPPSKTKAR